MRIYEFSKQYGVPVKEIMELLKTEGFEVKSHMSALHDKELLFLKNKLKKPASVSQEKKSIESQPLHETVKSEMLVKETSEKPSVRKIKTSAQPEKSIETPVISKPSIPSSQSVPVEIQSPSISIILKPMTVGDFALKINKPINEVILTLLKSGVIATKNQTLKEAIVEQLATHYGIGIKHPSVVKSESKVVATQAGAYIERHPVVVVIGHVDHGKTTLLDFIRKTKVASREKGGITQHLGAYEATTSHGKIVFLDTPGHEAFAKIRQRGLRVADIAILVVAADDGVMPQTIEAINFAKRIGLPIIVAITKVDKVEKTKIEVIKRELSQHGLLPEEWGGTVICVPVSAITGQGIDQLLEMVLLQSQIMELRTSLEVPAQGFVLESKVEKGRGPVATVITQQGIIALGDYFISGEAVGRINNLVDSYGKRMEKALPATPIQVSGFEQLPRVGDSFEIVSKEQYAKARSKKPESRGLMDKKITQEQAINLIVKADNHSSQEAIVDAIVKLKLPIAFNIIHSSVGDVSESDVELAANTESIIVGFHIKSELNAQLLAQRRHVKIELFDIIYRLLEALEKEVEEQKEIETVRKKIGEAVVRQVFDIKNIGVIAGCYVKDGKFVRDGIIIILRGNRKVGEAKIKSLQREKKSVKEVHGGFECGILTDGFSEWQVEDRIECYIDIPKE